MKNQIKIAGVLAICSALTFTSCGNENNNGVNSANESEYKEGTHGDSLNNLNNGGNYNPDVRQDNLNGTRTGDSTYGTTGSKFDANGNPVTGNDAINSNRQQDASTGNQSNTERRKQGE